MIEDVDKTICRMISDCNAEMNPLLKKEKKRFLFEIKNEITALIMYGNKLEAEEKKL